MDATRELSLAEKALSRQPPAFLFDEAASRGSPTTPSVGASGTSVTEVLSALVSINELLAAKLDRRSEHHELVRVSRMAARRAARIVDDLHRRRASLRGRRILVVEDDPTLLRVLVRALLTEGFDTVGAENGRRAVALLAPFKPDLLVTDLVMPEMDGIALIREAKRLRPDLGILAISAGGHYGRAANYLKWAAELGADEVLTKPFRMSSLLTSVRLLLHSSPPTAFADAGYRGEV